MNTELAISTWAAENLNTTPENIKSVRFEDEEASTCGYGTCHYPAVREAHVVLHEPLKSDPSSIFYTIDLESRGLTFADLLAELVTIGNR